MPWTDTQSNGGATLVVVAHDPDVIGRFDRTIDIASFCGQLQTTDGGGHSDER